MLVCWWCLPKQRMMEAISRAKLQSNHHHQQTNTQLVTGRITFLSPNRERQSTEGKNITFHGLAYPKLTWGLPALSLTTNSSRLTWGRVARPLISPLIPVSQMEITLQSNVGQTVTKLNRNHGCKHRITSNLVSK